MSGVEFFIPKYPDIDSDPQFSYNIARKKEFYDLRLERSEDVPEEAGVLLQSQKFMKRFFSPDTPYQSAILAHGVGTGKCVHPSTLIHTLNQIISIENIWDKYNSFDYTFEDEGIWSTPSKDLFVPSLDEKNSKIEYCKIKKLYKQPIKEEILDIELENGFKIVMTKAHKLYNGSEWINDPEVGQRVAFSLFDVGLSFTKVRSVANIMYEGYVYDLEIDKNHNYIANGILCHNSCAASAIVENYKNTIVDGRPRKPALVFVTSDELARNIINEVSMICTKDVYTAKPTELEIRKGIQMTKEAKIARINRAVSKTYEIVPMETFLRKMPSDEIIKKLYSRRVIIVDEAHRFRLQASRKKKEKYGNTSKEIFEELGDEEVEASFSMADDSTMMYKQMDHFLHTVEDCRKILLTGTPIWDKASEIASLLNLILEEDEKLPVGKDFDDKFFDEDGNLREDTKEELRSKIRGKISYLRPMMTTAKRIEQGSTAPWLKYIKVFPDAMSETQAAYANEAREYVEKKTIKIKGKTVERDVKGGTVLKTARDAMNMVLPIFDDKGNLVDVEYGPSAFKKHIVKTVKKRTGKGGYTNIQTYSIDNKFLKDAILNNLREYSTKFSSIIEDIKAHPKEITFVYNEEVTGLGGCIMLALCLQIHGFKWAKSANDIASPSTQKRFAVITSDSQTTNQPKQIYDLLLSANKADNKYGDRLQVIIGSEKIALGHSIKNVRAIHGVMPHWNIPSSEQFQGRGLRFGGQDALPVSERVVRIFKHVAVETAPDGVVIDSSFPKGAKFSAKETTDIYIYKIAEEKEHRNTQIYRIIKEEDFGCSLFYNRNVLPEDVDGSRECDYQECNYQCDGFPERDYESASSSNGLWDYSIPEEEIDYSTYNILYASGKVKEIIDRVIELFNGHFALSLKMVKSLLQISEAESNLLMYAIDIIINSRTLIRNSYGFPSYLKEDGNMLFLDDNISQSSDYLDSAYVENPFVSEITSLDSLVEIVELERDKNSVNEFCQNPSQDTWNDIAYKTKILLLEASYIQNLQAQDKGEELPEASSYVIEEMGNDIYIMDDDTPVHILYTEEFKGLAYDVASKDIKVTGVMRMYDTEYGSWKYVPREKEEEYVEGIKLQMIDAKQEWFENNPYDAFGWISKKDNSFRINLKQQPGKKGKIRGRKCKNFQVPDLIDIFIERLKYFPEPKTEYEDFSKEDLIKAIKGRPGFSKHKKNLEKKDEKYLRGLLTILTMHIDELCEELKSFFEKNDLLYTM